MELDKWASENRRLEEIDWDEQYQALEVRLVDTEREHDEAITNGQNRIAKVT